MASQADPDTQNIPSAVEAVGGWPTIFGTLIDGDDLTREQAAAAMTDILAGIAGPARIAALVVGLQAKGETVPELTGMAEAMTEAAEPLSVSEQAIDIVGTGGSQHRRTHALNVSTMASIVAAAAGAVVCKHGNRRASSTSGSFDFLEALGVAIDLEPAGLEQCVQRVGLGFAFARTFHPAMRFAGPVRADLGVPTVFNLLGPLANPGRVRRQVVGTSSEERAASMAEVLRALGSERAWVVSGTDGLDELSLAGTNVVFAVTQDGIERRGVTAGELGLATGGLESIAGGGPEDNAAIFARILDGEQGPHRDIVVLNAAAGLVVSGVVDELHDGMQAAVKAIEGGAATTTLDALRKVTNELRTASA